MPEIFARWGGVSPGPGIMRSPTHPPALHRNPEPVVEGTHTWQLCALRTCTKVQYSLCALGTCTKVQSQQGRGAVDLRLQGQTTERKEQAVARGSQPQL